MRHGKYDEEIKEFFIIIQNVNDVIENEKRKEAD